ncbi:pmo25 [Symbiodinium natans]|uniref:Pmo25 protein n=1 Tax=Symbiodinium natans TaxID=878477 RepID=A0A812TWD8_9DINO|nr:pmo25 [Symbiodinium natans]
MGILFKSQELFRRMGAPRCLPVARKSTKQPSPRDAVQKLTDEVEQLLCSPSSSESPSKKTEDLWKDVHNHLRTILNLLKDQRKGLRQRAKGQAEEAAPAQLVLPHFSLETPSNSRATSPRNADGEKGTSPAIPRSVEDSGHEHEASINFEWQFDILNHLPRDTALALMDFLKSQQRELSKTSRYANELTRSNKELHKRLQQKDQHKRPYCRWTILLVLLAVCLCMVALVATREESFAPPFQRQLLNGLDAVRASISDEAALPPAVAPTAAVGDGSWPEAQRWARQTQILQQGEGSGKIKETTVREMTLRETTTREYDPKIIQQLQTENLQMKLQLERDFGSTSTMRRRKDKITFVTQDQLRVLEQFLAADLPVQLLSQLNSLEFEVRKDVMNVCCALLWPDLPEEVAAQVMDYVRFHPTIFAKLMDSYANEEAALYSGVVLRSFFRYGQLVESFLISGKVYDLIGYARHPSMDVAADAIYTLRTVMLEHKEVSGPWLQANYDEFFLLYTPLLECQDYVVERQALTLLAAMLMDRNYQRVMMNFVNNEQHLKTFMNLLLADSHAIQAEAFHVFKIFVVNPQKPARIQQILVKNKDKLVTLLQSLHAVRTDDTNFTCDLEKVIKRLLSLTSSHSLKRPHVSHLSRTSSSISVATTTCDTESTGYENPWDPIKSTLSPPAVLAL